MSNVFDIKRFWKYLCWDLNNAKNNFWISLLICGGMPVVAFLFASAFTLLFDGHFPQFDLPAKFIIMCCALVVVILSFPRKQYGSLTEKRYGSDWLMLPASTLEKTVSVIVVSCVVLPVCFFGVLFAADILMGLALPVQYGDSVVLYTLRGISENREIINEAFEEVGLHINMPIVVYLSWCENILIFVLGAIFFKKAKVGKTLLAYLAFSMLLSSILMIVSVNGDDFEVRGLVNRFSDVTPEQAVKALKWLITIAYVVIFAALDLGIYFRIKTLKH